MINEFETVFLIRCDLQEVQMKIISLFVHSLAHVKVVTLLNIYRRQGERRDVNIDGGKIMSSKSFLEKFLL
jgi:hypothetical protein